MLDGSVAPTVEEEEKLVALIRPGVLKGTLPDDVVEFLDKLENDDDFLKLKSLVVSLPEDLPIDSSNEEDINEGTCLLFDERPTDIKLGRTVWPLMAPAELVFLSS